VIKHMLAIAAITLTTGCPAYAEESETKAAGIGPRPAEWCGWWMREHLGGAFGPEFNRARNWLNVGRPLASPRPGVLGVESHHVFRVVQVIGPEKVLAISGNDHNAVRTRIRSTSGVIGWRDVAEASIAAGSVSDGAVAQPISQAPVGHRQPTASSVRLAQAQISADKKIHEFDQALKKKLNGICRGC
jgi:hypothetical protein